MKRDIRLCIPLLALAWACSRPAPAVTDEAPASASPAEPAAIPPASPLDPKLAEALETAANRVLAAANALGSSKRERVVIGGPPTSATDWTIAVDATLPSPFSLGPSCNPGADGKPVSLCHVDGERTVCSQEGIEALLRLAARQQVPACSGDGGGPGAEPVDYASVEGTPTVLVLVLAHELGHLELGHTGGGDRLAPLARGSAEQRLRALREAATGAPAQLAVEREADAFAGKILHWLLSRGAAANGEHGDYFITYHTNAIRLALLCLDSASTCRWIDEPKLPPDPADIEHQALRLACMATQAPEGTLLPSLRGSHDDWATRMTLVHTLSKQVKDPVPGAKGLSDLVNNVSKIFVFWEQHGEAYTKALALAVRNRTLAFDPTGCASLSAAQ